MIAQYFAVGSSTPVLLVGPVDADYEVQVFTLSGQIWVGGSNGITVSPGGDACPLPASGSAPFIATLKLKVGDSLYALASSSADVGVFAQPC